MSNSLTSAARSRAITGPQVGSPSLATAVSPLTVQLQGDNGLCFETVLVTTKIDSAGKLEAK